MILVLALAIIFSGAIFWQTWYSSRAQMEEQIAREADLALEFDLAIRQYVAESVRPVAEQWSEEDEFIPELMSTSFVARNVFEKVRLLHAYNFNFSDMPDMTPWHVRNMSACPHCVQTCAEYLDESVLNPLI